MFVLRNRLLLTALLYSLAGSSSLRAEDINTVDVSPEARRLLDQADASVAKAAEGLDDPLRPRFHFHPAANWINDPNGPILHRGWYHVFFQHNPYGDEWGNMHWGHTRSRDLVNWERLPIAIPPSPSRAEKHVYSGCAEHDGDGNVLAFYTSVDGGPKPNEQWVAKALDDDLTKWHKPDFNPLLTIESAPGITFGAGFRDPFIFHFKNRTFMVVGADTQDESVIPLWEAEDDTLLNWKYLGIVWRTPKSKVKFPECPNFFELDGKCVLIISPYRALEYEVGEFDPDADGGPTFQVEKKGRLEPTDSLYASNILIDESGERILLGWARHFKGGRGWSGVLTLPRVLSLDKDLTLCQKPIRTLSTLRGESWSIEKPTRVESAEGLRPAPKLEQFEMAARMTIAPSDRGGIFLHRGNDLFTILWDEQIGLSVGQMDRAAKVPQESNGFVIPLDRLKSESRDLNLRIFVDRGLVEMFSADGRIAITRPWLTKTAETEVEFIAGGRGATLHSLDIWEMKDAKIQ
ncbi:glycoside hydrolase family 32 protein [Stratiformator vulcanicus]|uniref:beta-fructofuranosidase n=1 Tax=Stratiformator vulcanicus TaxID=2527980 RepID=A0A517R5C3_9PLAN|nr:glycoside hydrolase family 32 protein [Stratiformator vulcanicus]QDT39096.1 Sucrose-6-phosphate hydrolase [Stratiformator vulcanicus]